MINSRKDFLEEASHKEVICFGAGKFLRNIKGFLEAEGLTISHLIDNDSNKWGKRIDNLIVESPHILSDHSGEAYLIFISTKNFADEIEKQIETGNPDKFSIFRWPLEISEFQEFNDKIWHERISKPCESLYNQVATCLFGDERLEEREKYMSDKRSLITDKSKVILPRTALMITTRCTLRCKECNNLMPYYERHKEYKADEIIEWIKNICDAVDEWICLELVGGEPFLYRDLLKVLKYVLTENKIQQIEFTTNASIIPNREILELLRDKKVYVKISEYPKLIDASKLVAVLDQYKIRYEIKENMRWTKTGALTSRNRTDIELQSQYLNCNQAKMCRTIMNGKMYVCSKASSLMELGYADNLETVDLLDKENLRTNIQQFLRLPYSRACNYCDIASKDEEIVEAAEQSI